MARKRMMHADMFCNAGFLRLSLLEQKLWMFLILIADDFGRMNLDSISLKAQCFPLDAICLEEIDIMIEHLEKYMSFRSYEVDGERYGILIHFLDFQVLDRPSRSRIPDPPSDILEQLHLPQGKDGKVAGWVSDLLRMGYAGPVNVSPDIAPAPAPVAPPVEPEEPGGAGKRKRFTPPTVEEVQAYCTERGNGVDAARFMDFYTANGWKQGKGKPIVDWKATVRTWENREKGNQSASKMKEGNYDDVKI